MHRTRVFATTVALLTLFVTTELLAKAKITIRNDDAPGIGLNDQTPVQPVGGNPGTTQGEQALNVFKRAAEIWGGIIDSDVEIIVSAQFGPLECSANEGVLGSTQTSFVSANTPNVPIADVVYPLALANKFAGESLIPDEPDMVMNFNSKAGTKGCLEFVKGWYYGFDNKHGESSDLLMTMLHEMAHGLGFTGVVNASNGQYQTRSRVPSPFERHILDTTQSLRWDQMTATQRSQSARNSQNLVWDGESVRAATSKTLQASPILRVNTPSSIAGGYIVGSATFGPAATAAGTTSKLVAAMDAVEPSQPPLAGGTASDGCSPLTNAGEIRGNIAVIDRSVRPAEPLTARCGFFTKAMNAQLAGAIGVIIVDLSGEAAPINMSHGDGDPTAITIPTVMVSTANGSKIRGELVNGVQATIALDFTRLAGADANGFARLYAPSTVDLGSSIYHFDTSALPNMLMEPFISEDLKVGGVDLTANLLADLGWTLSSSSPATPQQGPPSGRRILRRGH